MIEHRYAYTIIEVFPHYQVLLIVFSHLFVPIADVPDALAALGTTLSRMTAGYRKRETSGRH